MARGQKPCADGGDLNSATLQPLASFTSRGKAPLPPLARQQSRACDRPLPLPNGPVFQLTTLSSP
eukprot:scaffold1172_cov124-Isochrysis_galbana.AAC.1